ncbi:MAG: T9SS type A sorting domain-containing protein [Bacteroidales bacterium]|nr:T9SS type A sorting domain-containing protein [Bacteroidales bacterium]
MKKASSLTILLILLVFQQLISQETATNNTPDGAPVPETVIVADGRTLNDLSDLLLPDPQQTDIDPGILPEGDFMFRSSFTNDGQYVLVANGGTDNVTVFDFATMTPVAVVEVGDYPCDVAVTDDYAVVPCIFGNEIYVIDLSDFTVAGSFPADEQPVSAVVSPDGNFAYVGCDINDKCEVINLSTMSHEATFNDFPIELISYSWISTGGRSSFKFSSFSVTNDGTHLIVGNSENDVLFINTTTGNVDYSVSGIANCFVTGVSGDGNKTVALSNNNNVFNVYQIDNATHAITGTVLVSGYSLSTYEVGVNQDGNKAYVGISNNSSAIVRFQTSDFKVFTDTYTAFWIGTSADHNYIVNGQFRFCILDFATETILGQNWGNTQTFGCVSPTDLNVVGYDPLRYEGLFFYDCTNPNSIVLKGKELSGWPPEGDTPYRIAISPDGSRAVTSNSISHNTSIVNLDTYQVDTIISLGESSDAVAITHDSQWAVMGGYDLNTIKLIDLSGNEFVTSVVTGQRPMMVTISPDDNYAYIGNLKGNSVSFVELDGANSAEIVEIPTGVIGLSWAAFGVRSSVEVDPTGQYILVAASFEDKVQVIDIQQQQIVANLPVGTFPLKIAFNATGEYACVTNYNSDSYSIIHVDGANSTVVGTFPCNGDYPMRLAYNEVDDEFGVVNYGTKTVININPQTGAINSTDYYTQYGSPVMIDYDVEGKPLVLTLSNDDAPGHLIRDGEAIALPATPTYFDYSPASNKAVVCMPGPDYVTVIEYDPNTNPPEAGFTANVTTIYVGESVEFSDLSLNFPTSWDWTFEGGDPVVSALQDPVVTYNTTGVYDVALTAANAYGSDTETKADYITVNPLVFIDEKGSRTEISLSPNPVTDLLSVHSSGKLSQPLAIMCFSSQGRLMISCELTAQESFLDMSGLKAGLYLLKVISGENHSFFKILKQ